MPKTAKASPATSKSRALARLQAESEHFQKTVKNERKAPAKRDPTAPIPKRKKVEGGKGVTKPKTTKTPVKKTRDQKAEEEARAFVAKENKKKGIEKSLTELTWNREETK